MNWLLKTSIGRTGKREWRMLESACRAPRAAQARLVENLLQCNGSTRFGRDHGFATIRSLDDFRQRVPIRDYDGLKSYVDTIMSGGSNVLTRCPPFMFNLTSGTTGTPKYIPWNAPSDRAGAMLMRQWIYRSLEAHPAMLDHHAFCMVSPAIEKITASGMPAGSASGRIYQKIPAVVRRHYANPYVVSEIQDYDKRYLAAIRLCIGKRVSVVSTPNPATLVRLAETGDRCKEKILRAVHDGTLGLCLEEQPAVQRALERSLTPDPAAASRLERVAAASGKLYPRDYWPDLQLIGCWTGGSVGTQLGKLARYFGDDVPVRDLGYLASEGRMSLPIEDQTASGVLAINTNFYEFIAEDDIENPAATLLCDELETGKHYYVILTTASGLYRYDMNDVIEVTGWHHDCPMIRFVRKGRDVTSITGEKVHVNHCLAAMCKLATDLDLDVEQFRFVADETEGTYHVLVEPGDWSPTGSSCTALAAAVDRELAALNMEYDQKRRSGRLSAPRVRIMPRGWSAAERRAAVLSGRRDVEFKWRHLLPADQCTDRLVT